MKKILTFLAKLSLLWILLIIFEGAFTAGKCFELSEYPWWAWAFQIPLLIIIIWGASEDWE